MARIPKETLDYFRRQGAKGGKLSGEARMKKLTPEQRSEIAKKAAAARWGKMKALDASAPVKRKKAK